MQALAARQAAFCSSGSVGRRPAARSRRAVAVRADVGFCRDKVSQPQDLRGQIEGTSIVVFLGVDGQQVPVECPKVRQGRRGAVGPARLPERLWARLGRQAGALRDLSCCPQSAGCAAAGFGST